MGKKKKNKSALAKATPDKSLKTECCEKYLKKGEHKRCKRCPCFDMNTVQRLQRFKNLEIERSSKDSDHK